MKRFIDGFEHFGETGAPMHKRVEAYLLKIGVTKEEIATLCEIMFEP